MQIVIYGFMALLVMTCVYAVAAGGRDAWIACGMLISAALMTPVVTVIPDARWLLFVVDGVLLIGLVALAMRSSHYWPMWVAGLHGVSVAGHVVTTLTPHLPWNVYHAIIAFWAIPVQLVMALGIFLDSRATKYADGENR